MIRPLFALAVAALVASPAVADDYKLTGENTKITFTGTKPNGKHDGGFNKLTGTATTSGGMLTKIEVEIDCDSLYSDADKLTTHLKNPDFFGVKDNPKATFKTTKVEKTDKGYSITGDLMLIGKTKSVTFPASVSEKDGVLSLSTAFQIDRTQWGMNYGAKGQVDKEVTIRVAVTAKK
jgi:polyisoprenoid-binding protein YceI